MAYGLKFISIVLIFSTINVFVSFRLSHFYKHNLKSERKATHSDDSLELFIKNLIAEG